MTLPPPEPTDDGAGVPPAGGGAAFSSIALIRQTALEFDQLKPEEVIARMKPLAAPGEPWFGSAGEMTALALVKQGGARLKLPLADVKTALLSSHVIHVAAAVG